MKLATLNVFPLGGRVERVEEVLSGLPGVATIAVSLPERRIDVLFDETGVDAEQMRAALRGAGYEVAAAR